MKRFSVALLFTAIIALFVLPSAAPAQFVTGYNAQKILLDEQNGVAVAFKVTVDSLETDTSKAFQIGKYDDDLFSTYPVMAGYKTTSVLGKPHVKMTILGSFGDGVWNVVDTVVANDSAETYAVTSLDFNAKKYPWYRVLFSGLTNTDVINNRSDSYAILTLYFYRKGF